MLVRHQGDLGLGRDAVTVRAGGADPKTGVLFEGVPCAWDSQRHRASLRYRSIRVEVLVVLVRDLPANGVTYVAVDLVDHKGVDWDDIVGLELEKVGRRR